MNEDYYDSYGDCQTDEECNAFFNRQIARVNRADRSRYVCPQCDQRCLSAYQHQKGYVCDSCADRNEGLRGEY